MAGNARVLDLEQLDPVAVGIAAIAGGDRAVAVDRSGVERHAGGFQPLDCSEDVQLVLALQAMGARIAWSARPRVVTSARRHGRVIGGFADALRQALAPASLLPATAAAAV